MPLPRNLLLAAPIVVICFVATAAPVSAQGDYPPTVPLPPVAPSLSGGEGGTAGAAYVDPATSNPMLWQQYQALQAGGYAEEDCEACSGSGVSDYNRCGCNTAVFPWNSGPGNCDVWCVGPKWAVEGGGLFMFRDDANWNGVIAALPGAPAAVLTDQFEHGPGGRVFLTGYNDSGFGIQIGYEGINDWDASLAFAPGEFVANETRDFLYQSRLNSLEINFLTNNPSPWKLFSGFRYVQLDEDFIESRIVDKPIPVPVVAPPVGTPFVDLGFHHLLENRLFGFQLGGRRDAWQWGNRFTVSTFANAGVYCNKFSRDDVELTITTIITADDLSTPAVNEFSQTTTTAQTTVRRDFADIAFVGEAGLAAAWRLNQCTAVRAGYQILALDGVGQGLDAFLAPNAGLDNSTLVFHGLQFGLEYRR